MMAVVDSMYNCLYVNTYARKKSNKHQDLVAECENRGWTVYYCPVEVGSRGIYNTSVSKLLASLEIPSGKRKPIMDTASKTALRVYQLALQKYKGILTDEVNTTTFFMLLGRGTVER